MANRIPNNIKNALTAAKNRLTAIYAQRLKDVILFGSYARGDYVQGSDIDLLLLLDRVSDPSGERDRYLPVVWDLSLKFDTVLSVITMDDESFRTGKTPLILNVRREGVRI